MVVGDDTAELADVRVGARLGDLVVIIGGLGPTDDDITRGAIAQVLQTPLDIHEHVVDRIRERFVRRGMEMPEINRRQAMAPRGATLLDNPNGTAPGLWIERGPTAIVALPGPPREMTPMFDAVIRERLAARSGGGGLFRRVVKVTGRAESDVDTHAQPIYGRWTSARVPITTTILAVLGQIELHLTARRKAARGRLRRWTPRSRAQGGPRALCLARTAGAWKWWSAIFFAETPDGGGRRVVYAGGLLTSRLTDVLAAPRTSTAALSATAISPKSSSSASLMRS